MDPIVLIPISILFLGAMIVGRNEIVRRRLTCPTRKTPADIRFVRRVLNPGKLLRVETCSLMADPERVDCGQECLKSGI